jgi:pyruvate dehydrogenase E1 component alpha subunit
MMMDPAIGFYGANGITGGSIPFAAGVALDAKLRGTGRVTVCFFGDGASNQGVFHESLNLAALWKLPVLFVVENNGYAMSTSTARGLSNTHIAERAGAYGIPGASVDGNDFFAVRDCVAQHASAARAGQGPALLECVTYRLSGHSRGDARVYRSRGGVRRMAERPDLRLETRLKDDGTLTATTPRRPSAKRPKLGSMRRSASPNHPPAGSASLHEDLFA